MTPSAPSLFEAGRSTLADALELTAASLRAYGPGHDHWAVAFSGGKDSSALLTATVHLIEAGRVPRPRRLYVLYGDTRMELPPLQATAMELMRQLGRREWVDARVVMAPLDERYFVYMLGRGVPPPNNNTLRWCTAQIKVEPMAAELRRVRAESAGKPLMLIGVRVGESAARDARIAVACSRNGAECGQGWYQRDLPDAACDKLSPILHWRTCQVWDWLTTGLGGTRPGAPATDLLARVRAGEITKSEALAQARGRRPGPDHGFPTREVAWAYGLSPEHSADEVSARTGCVGCPLATRDTALDNLIRAYPAEWGYLAPLKRLRPLYRELREPHNRLRQPPGERRKDGSLTGNQNRMGPLTMSARLRALDDVLAVQAECNAVRGDRPAVDILNAEEESRIRELIAANTWPNRWTGDEPVADEPYEAVGADGSRQLLLDGIVGGGGA